MTLNLLDMSFVKSRPSVPIRGCFYHNGASWSIWHADDQVAISIWWWLAHMQRSLVCRSVSRQIVSSPPHNSPVFLILSWNMTLSACCLLPLKLRSFLVDCTVEQSWLRWTIMRWVLDEWRRLVVQYQPLLLPSKSLLITEAIVSEVRWCIRRG